MCVHVGQLCPRSLRLGCVQTVAPVVACFRYPPHPFPLHPSLAPWRGVRVPSLVRGHGEGAQPPRAHAWLLHDWSCSTARNSSLPPRPQEAFPLLQPTQRSLLPEIL